MPFSHPTPALTQQRPPQGLSSRDDLSHPRSPAVGPGERAAAVGCSAAGTPVSPVAQTRELPLGGGDDASLDSQHSPPQGGEWSRVHPGDIGSLQKHSSGG